MSQQEGKFRTSVFGGYNRTDVLNFITESTQAHQAEVNDLRGHIGYLENQLREADALQDQLAELDGRCQSLQEEVIRLEQENNELHARCEAMEQEKSDLEAEYAVTAVDAHAYAVLKDQVGSIELEARSRSQTMLNEAEAAVARIYEQANHSLDKVRWNYNGACTNVESILAHLVDELRRSEQMLTELSRAMDEGKESLASLHVGREEK